MQVVGLEQVRQLAGQAGKKLNDNVQVLSSVSITVIIKIYPIHQNS